MPAHRKPYSKGSQVRRVKRLINAARPSLPDNPTPEEMTWLKHAEGVTALLVRIKRTKSIHGNTWVKSMLTYYTPRLTVLLDCAPRRMHDVARHYAGWVTGL